MSSSKHATILGPKPTKACGENHVNSPVPVPVLIVTSQLSPAEGGNIDGTPFTRILTNSR
jgi:hypothetical protein